MSYDLASCSTHVTGEQLKVTAHVPPNEVNSTQLDIVIVCTETKNLTAYEESSLSPHIQIWVISLSNISHIEGLP
jgi:hypothetical protein